MTGYTKLFGSIITSTIWCEDNETRLVWITMLALKNQDHIVEGSVPGLAAMARVTVEQCQGALDKLKAPDPHSRTKDFQGRRIEDFQGGWRILNGEFYRNKMNADERREYFRIKQAEHRARKKSVKDTSKMSKTVNDKYTLSTQSEAEAEAEAYIKTDSFAVCTSKHSAFIKGWTDNFKARFGVDYKFDGGRDGKAVKSLLGFGIEMVDLLEIAKKAWDSTDWNCKQAVTIHGFRHQLNQIQVKVYGKPASGDSGQHPDRNKGTCNEGDSALYRDLGKVVKCPALRRPATD